MDPRSIYLPDQLGFAAASKYYGESVAHVLESA